MTDDKHPKKITNKAIKEMISRMPPKITKKSTSVVDANGELVQLKYFNRKFDNKFDHDSENVNEATPEIRTLPGDEYHKVRKKIEFISNYYDEGDESLVPRKKSKVRKNKRVKRKCRCV